MSSFVEFDGNLLIAIQNALYAEWLTPIMKFITMWGEAVSVIAILILLMLFKKTRRLGIVCSATVLLTFLVCNLIIKPGVNRTRPWVLFEAVNRMIPDPGDPSFPSGHATNFSAIAWSWFLATLPVKRNGEKLWKPEATEMERLQLSGWNNEWFLGWKSLGFDRKTMNRVGIFMIFFGILIGISRWYLGVHFPSDVICGWLIAIIGALIVHTIFRKLTEKNDTMNEPK